MGIFDRIKKIVNAEKKQEFKPKTDLFSLKQGDMVNIEGEDYEVQGAMYIDCDGWKWTEYKLKEGRATYWLSVEKDDDLELILCKKVIRDSDDIPKKLIHDGIKYYLDENGAAIVEGVAGDMSVPRGKRVEYWDYYDEKEEKAFFIEKWDGEIEASMGRYIEEYNVEIFPVSEE